VSSLVRRVEHHLFAVTACLDRLENGRPVSVAEAERTRLAIECVANIEQWRGDARLAGRLGFHTRSRVPALTSVSAIASPLIPRPMKPTGYAASIIEPPHCSACVHPLRAGLLLLGLSPYGRYSLGRRAVADSACTMMLVTRQPPTSFIA